MPRGLTAETVKHAKSAKVRREIPDGYLPGLYLVVQPSGAKSWAVRYRVGGKPYKYTFGRYPAIALAGARELGAEALRSVAGGMNPAQEKAEAKRLAKQPPRKLRSQIVLFEEVVDDFIANYAKKRTRDWKNTEAMLKRHFVSRWSGMDVAAIQKRDVLDALDDMVEDGLGPGANRAFSQLRKMYNWLVEKDRLKGSPCYGLKKPVDESSRDRYLSDEEVFLHWSASDALPYPWGPCFKLLLLLGQRLSEVARSPWSEFDGNHWSIPKERTKNRRPQELLLPTQAMAIIDALPRIPFLDENEQDRMSPYLFTTVGYAPISGFSKKSPEHADIMRKLAGQRAEAAGLDPRDVTIEPFTNHDLRRTMSTYFGRLRIPAEVGEATLNHVSGKVSGVAKVYNRWEYFDEKGEALQKWADHVDLTIAKFSGGNVIDLRAAR